MEVTNSDTHKNLSMHVPYLASVKRDLWTMEGTVIRKNSIVLVIRVIAMEHQTISRVICGSRVLNVNFAKYVDEPPYDIRNVLVPVTEETER